jgi:hypothetical protein
MSAGATPSVSRATEHLGDATPAEFGTAVEQVLNGAKNDGFARTRPLASI